MLLLYNATSVQIKVHTHMYIDEGRVFSQYTQDKNHIARCEKGTVCLPYGSTRRHVIVKRSNSWYIGNHRIGMSNVKIKLDHPAYRT